MNNLKSKILSAISKGLNESLNYIEDLDNEDEFSLSKKSVSQAIKDNSDLKTYYSNKLQNMLLDPMEVNEEFIDQALELHNKYGALYNPHLDGMNFNFKHFIDKCISIQGNEADLNWIDTSEVTVMPGLFNNFDILLKSSGFNGDISEWDVSHVTNMHSMFYYSYFNGDISSWDVSNVINMSLMFTNSEFNGNISNWNVSSVTDMKCMFEYSIFNSDISLWDVSDVINMEGMFKGSVFNLDISRWDVSNVVNMNNMFNCSNFNGDISLWDVSNVKYMDEIFRDSKFEGNISNWKLSPSLNLYNARKAFYDSQIDVEYLPTIFRTKFGSLLNWVFNREIEER